VTRYAILHHDDWDGIVSAWVIAKYYPDEADAVQEQVLWAVQYGNPLPDGIEGFGHVFIVDFSYPQDVLERLASCNERLTLIDHHRTAIENLADWELPGNVTVRLESGDPSRPFAACELAWDHAWLTRGCHPPPRPLLVQYVADRDTWRFALPHSKAVSVCIQTMPMTLEQCDGLHARLSDDGSSAVDVLADRGKTIIGYQQQCIDRAIRHATKLALPGADRAYVGLAVNMPIGSMISDAAQRLASMDVDGEPADFGCCYFVTGPGQWTYSLRSAGGFDVAALAKHLGGGGHPSAAGFTATIAPWDWRQ